MSLFEIGEWGRFCEQLQTLNFFHRFESVFFLGHCQYKNRENRLFNLIDSITIYKKKKKKLIEQYQQLLQINKHNKDRGNIISLIF